MKKFLSIALVVALASTAFAADAVLDGESLTAGALAGQAGYTTTADVNVVAGGLDYIGGTAGDEVAGYGILGGTQAIQLGLGTNAESARSLSNTGITLNGTSETKYYSYVSHGDSRPVTDGDSEIFLKWSNSWGVITEMKPTALGCRIDNSWDAGDQAAASVGVGINHFVAAYDFDGSGQITACRVYLNPDPSVSLTVQTPVVQDTNGPTAAGQYLHIQMYNIEGAQLDNVVIGGSEAEVSAKAFVAGDTDRDFDVDIFDFNNLKSNFNPIATANKFSQGDFDNDGNTDIFDFNDLKTAFNPIGYAPAAGEVELQVNIATGEVTLVGDAASIDGFQITSAGGSLVAGALDLSGLVGMSNFGSFATFAAAGNLMGLNAVDGSISLGVLYDAGVDAQDLTFDVTGGAGNAGVVYVPEPASMALLALGGLAVIRRRRRA